MAQVEGWDVVVHCASGTDGIVPALKVVPFQLGAKRSSTVFVPADPGVSTSSRAHDVTTHREGRW